MLAMLAATVGAQTTTTCAAGSTPPFSYFASGGAYYDYYGKSPSVSTGFGVKTGQCSNAFLNTDISSGVGPSATAPTDATVTETLEYHLAHSGNFDFIGQGAIGAVQSTTTSGTVTAAMFAGGVAVSYDAGYALSKGKMHLPVVLKFLYTAITATEVKPVYGVEFRKTF
jgi:hypothetical protein